MTRMTPTMRAIYKQILSAARAIGPFKEEPKKTSIAAFGRQSGSTRIGRLRLAFYSLRLSREFNAAPPEAPRPSIQFGAAAATHYPDVDAGLTCPTRAFSKRIENHAAMVVLSSCTTIV